MSLPITEYLTERGSAIISSPVTTPVFRFAPSSEPTTTVLFRLTTLEDLISDILGATGINIVVLEDVGHAQVNNLRLDLTYVDDLQVAPPIVDGEIEILPSVNEGAHANLLVSGDVGSFLSDLNSPFTTQNTVRTTTEKDKRQRLINADLTTEADRLFPAKLRGV